MRYGLLLSWVTVVGTVEPSRFRQSVFSPLQSLDVNATAPPVDREYEYPHDFRLDVPFHISLAPHESVLVPLAPIHNQLFGGAAASIAIGLELSTCQGRVITTLAMQSGSMHRLSSAQYQCTTLTTMPSTPPVDLCPLIHGGRDIAIHKDPTKVKGVIVRADATAEVVALWRSTKDHGAYNRAFFVDEDPIKAMLARQFNVSYTTDSTQIMFHSAREWQPSSNETTICDGCQYELYAVKSPSSNISDSHPLHAPPPYCLNRKDSITYLLRHISGSSRQHLTLPGGFSDLFSTSDNYTFTLVVSIPTSANNGHPAMFTYTPTRVSVTASRHSTYHVLFVIAVIVGIAFLPYVIVTSNLWERLSVTWRPQPESSQDEESVRLLAQVIAEHDAEEALEHQEDQGGEHDRPSESLPDVIRKTKAQEATPQPSPRHPPGAHLEGYHEIN